MITRGSGRGWLVRVTLVFLLILEASSGASPHAVPGPAVHSEPPSTAHHDLHQGLYARAEEQFRALVAGAPGDPRAHFMVAFTRWWRILLSETSHPENDPGFDAAIDATLEAGERQLDGNPDDVRALAAVGGAHILKAHVEAMRKHYFGAARAARRGKRLLERALEQEPQLYAALFPLGAFNYFADRVPLIVKGIRFLLFLPGGDAGLGLRQIGAVASSQSDFRTDARILLAIVCGSREELAYGGARGHLHAALDDNPGSPVIAAALAELEMRLGYYEEAARVLEAALTSSFWEEPDRANQRRRLRLALAEAWVASWRLERGERELKQAAQGFGALPAPLTKLMIRVQRELRAKRDLAPFWTADVDSLDTNHDALLQRLNDEVNARAGDALARFLRGRFLVGSGRYEEAREDLRAAAGLMTDPPPWLEGWIELYSGMAEARMGNTRAARRHFRRASEVRKFRSADRGYLERHHDEDSTPECAP